MFKVSSVAGRYWYLDHVNLEKKKEAEHSPVYLLVEYRGKIKPVYFWRHDNWWIESLCILRNIHYADEQPNVLSQSHFDEFVFESILSCSKPVYRNGYFYQIENYQCTPFLPEEMIFHQILSETECLDWLLADEKREHK